MHVLYELHRRDADDQWYYHSSDWDFEESDGPLPTSDELADMLEDWLNDNDETEGTWSLTAQDEDEELPAVSGVVEL